MTETSQVVVEVAPFQLSTGTTEAELQAASSKLQEEFLSKQPGYLQRDLLKKSDREYIDIVHWASKADAQKAMQAAPQHAVCRTYFQLMEGLSEDEDGGISHFSLLSSYR